MTNYDPRYLIGYVLNLTKENPPGSVDTSEDDEARIKFDGTRLLVSFDGSSYQPIATGSASQAFIDGGNSFGATATLGTNDANPLEIETNGVTHATLTTNGELLVGYAAPSGTETFGVLGDVQIEGSEVITDGADSLTIDKNSITATADLTLSVPGDLDLAPTGELQINGAVGGAGDVLTSNGAGLPPTWQTPTPVPVNAFVDGGNSFTAPATLGTNDAFALQLETNNTVRATLTTAGELLVGYNIPLGVETLGTAGTLYVAQRALVGASSFSGAENLKVRGGALLDDGGAKTAFLGIGKGSSAGLSGPQEAHFRYEENLNVPQVSVSAGAFYDIITSNTLANTAFVQGGNNFGGVANLGTTGADDLAFKTNGSEKARVTSGGALLVGIGSVSDSEKLRVYSSLAGNGTTKWAGIVEQTITGADTGFVGGLNIQTNPTVDTPSTQSSGAALNVQMSPDGSGTKSIMAGAQIQSQVKSTALAAAGAVTTLYGTNSTIGYSFAATPTSGSITNAFHFRAQGLGNTSAARTVTNFYGIRIDNQGATGITNAFGIDVVAQTGAATTNIGIRSQGSAGAAVFGTTAMSGTEAVRVAGNGILIDGTTLNGSVSSVLSLNNSGGAINIGSNADAQAINLGTGAAARTITVGNSTGATAVNLTGGSGFVNSTTRFNVKNASGLYVLDGGGTNGVYIDQQSGTTHKLASTGTTTTFRMSPIFEMGNNITALNDGTYNIGTEAARFAQITQKTSAVKTHAAFSGSLVYEETGAIQTAAAGFTTIYTLALVDNSGYWIDAFFIGRDTGSGNRGMFHRQICGYRQGGGAANVGGNATIGTDYNPGGWGGAQLTTSGNNIVAQVNGAGATTINWAVTIRWQYVSSNV